MTPKPYDPYRFIVERRIADIEDMRRSVERASLPFYLLISALLIAVAIVLA